MLSMLASGAIICPNLPRMSGQHLEENESIMMPMSPQKHPWQWLMMDHNIKTSSAHRYCHKEVGYNGHELLSMHMANSRVLLIVQTGMKNFSEVNSIVFMDLHGLDEVIVIDALV